MTVGPLHLVARLHAIRESRMRVFALIEALGEGDPGVWVTALAALVERTQRSDDAAAAAAVQCLTHAAGDPALPYATRQRLYEAAIERGLSAVARLFFASSPAPAAGCRAARPAAARPGGRGAIAARADRPLTLGERKALARAHDREQLLALLRDPHPAVVAILLENPHVTEADVLQIASARPAAPAALARLAAHPRWSVRHAVKRALVQNPSTPLADAIRIATTLRPADLAELATDPALPGPLRAHAAELRAVSLRRGGA